MPSPRHTRMITEFHERTGISNSTHERLDLRRGTLIVTTPAGMRWVLVDTQDGLWYAVWRNQPLPAERTQW